MNHNSEEITPEDLSALNSLPPYPSLTPKQHSWLESIMNGISPVLHIRSAHPAPRLGYPKYTAPLPSVSFDLNRISKKAIRKYVDGWIDSEEKRLGLSQPQGPKGKSRNRDQKYKLGDWRMVEIARRRIGSSLALQPLERKARIRAKKHGLRYYRQVITAYQLAQTNLPIPSHSIPPSPESVGKAYSPTQVAAAVKKVMAEKPRIKTGK